jgi:hypothetical protein
MDEQFTFLIPLSAVIGGIFIVALRMQHISRLRELQYRERIARIEKGLAPPPELDPARFEETMPLAPGGRAERFRTAGVTFIGIGAGLALLIAVAGGDVRAGIGVGGSFIALGAALVYNARLKAADERARDQRSHAAQE